MSSEKVIEKILAEAKENAQKIISEAEQKLADEKAKLDQQLNDFQQQTKTLVAKAAEDEKTHIIAAEKMALAIQFLAEKRKILDQAFNAALKQLQKLPDDQYRKLIVKLLLESAETGEEEVIIDKNEKRIDQQLIDKINKQLSSPKKSGLKLSSQKQDIGPGFILKRGKINTNVTLDVLLNIARKELEIDLAKQLFAN